jgi:hypothetical protein
VLRVRQRRLHLVEGLVDQSVDVALQRIRRLLRLQRQRHPELVLLDLGALGRVTCAKHCGRPALGGHGRGYANAKNQTDSELHGRPEKTLSNARSRVTIHCRSQHPP